MKFYINLWFVLLIPLLFNCNDERHKRPYPLLKTLEVTGITAKSAKFSAIIEMEGSEPVEDHGFIWGLSSELYPYYSKVISLGNSKVEGSFETNIDTVIDETIYYYVKAYLKTNTYTVYGNIVKFTSLGKNAPVLNNISPASNVNWGDTITITGKNFSPTTKNNVVYFNNMTVTPCYTSDTLLRVVVPSILSEEVVVYVEIVGNKSGSKNIALKLPAITGFSPQTADIGDTITVNFERALKFDINAYFTSGNNPREFPAKIVSKTNDQIKVIVPCVNSLKTKIVFTIGTNNFLSSDFTLAPPQITSISPTEFRHSTTFRVTGKNFVQGHTDLRVNGTIIYPENLTNTSFDFFIEQLDESAELPVTVTVLGQTVKSAQNLKFFMPVFTETARTIEIFPGDTLTLKGKDFPPTNEISCDIANIVSSTSERITLVFNENILHPSPSIILIRFNGYMVDTRPNISWLLKKPVVTSFSPTNLKNGDEITIRGKYLYKEVELVLPLALRPFFSFNKTYISTEEVKFKLTKCIKGAFNVSLFYNFNYDQIPLTSFTFSSPYSQKNITYPGYFYFMNLFSSVINDSLYVFSYQYYDNVYTVDPDVTTCKFVYTKPTDNLIYSSGFAIDNTVYMVGNKMLSYTPTTSDFVELKGIPGVQRINAFSFTIGKKGYLGGGSAYGSGYQMLDFWEYDPFSDSWTQKSNFPGTVCLGASTFVINSKAYVVNKKEVWEYDSSSDKWTRKNDFPGKVRYHSTTFILNNYGYIQSGCIYSSGYGTYSGVSSELYCADTWKYDPLNDSWEQKTDYPGHIGAFGIGIVRNGKVYMGLPINGEYPYYHPEMFEYDPSQDL